MSDTSGEPAEPAASPYGPVRTAPAPGRPDPAHSQAVLADYRRRMRRSRARYYAVVAVILAAVLVGVGVAWSRGEAAHVTLHTAAHPAPSITPASPAAAVHQLWSSADHTAIGTPYAGGTVVTYDEHSVQGRNATTGAVTWSYTRSDRSVCTAAQMQGVTVAVYLHKGNCDEVTALDTQTGRRDWTRTLDENDQPVLGRPQFEATAYGLMVVTPSVIYVMNDQSSGSSAGSDVFVYGEANCVIHSAVLGAAGALISQTCTNRKCSGLQFCHNGSQLVLRQNSNISQTDDQKKNNPDQLIWNLAGNTWIPVSGDNPVTALDAQTGQLMVLAASGGATKATLPLGHAASGPVTAVSTSDLLFVWVDGYTYALDTANYVLTWTLATGSPPTVTTPDPTKIVGPFRAVDTTILARVPGGAAVIDPTTGQVGTTISATLPAGTDPVYPLGSGLVVTGNSTAVWM